MKIIAFSGSNSSSSINQQFVHAIVTKIDFSEVEVIDLRDYPAPIYGIDLEQEKASQNQSKNWTKSSTRPTHLSLRLQNTMVPCLPSWRTRSIGYPESVRIRSLKGNQAYFSLPLQVHEEGRLLFNTWLTLCLIEVRKCSVDTPLETSAKKFKMEWS